ncbi:unnamed protein product [Calicophoron daubneyi]|uniref:Uncharacterized protein n=1 Tax=Calicophoron daubneyi TaxID=300641 RepID=A0AAV2THP7_CALDB
MASAKDELRESFLAYCNLTSHGSKNASSSTIRKMCTDTGINKTKMSQNDIDLEYCRCFGTAKTQVDYKSFKRFIEEFLGPVYGKMNGIETEEAIAEVKRKIAEARPNLDKTTKLTDAPVTHRLLDPNLYPAYQKAKMAPEKGKKGPGNAGQK